MASKYVTALPMLVVDGAMNLRLNPAAARRSEAATIPWPIFWPVHTELCSGSSRNSKASGTRLYLVFRCCTMARTNSAYSAGVVWSYWRPAGQPAAVICSMKAV